MNIKEMHYDFKLKLNKLDSQKNRNILVPEIDWVLNTAEKLLVKIIAFPRMKPNMGFEFNQRTIEDIRTVVKESPDIPIVNNVIPIPGDYEYFVKGHCLTSKGNCKNIRARLFIAKHGNMHEESSFFSSSFLWREIYGLFREEGIKLLKDDTFSADTAKISYIRKRKFMHNAASFYGGTYNALDGTVLTGTQNCELPEIVHAEVVDLAVFLTANSIPTKDVNFKNNILGLNGTI